MVEENKTESKKLQIKKKEFRYRGKSVDELKGMELREFASLLRANEKRTVMRQSDELQRFLIRAGKKILKNKHIRTHARYLIIVPKMVGMRIGVYNGKEFVQFNVENEMMGHRLGEFSVTRNKVKHGSAGVGATRSSASRSVK